MKQKKTKVGKRMKMQFDELMRQVMENDKAIAEAAELFQCLGASVAALNRAIAVQPRNRPWCVGKPRRRRKK